MCGLAGWFSKYPIIDNDLNCLKRMIASIQHRGPDGQGFKISSHAALGHARLSIIDLDNGSQPMTTTDDMCHIVFNGEIYNYLDLKKKLQSKGHVFQTSSDTEVILHLYRNHGLDAFKYLRGMFAIAIWDDRLKRGLLVRDQTGIKPLFYKISKDEVIFASEAKAILARANNDVNMNLNALHLLMNFRYLPGDLSLFKDIYQLPPGEIMEWHPDGISKRYTYIYESEISDKTILELMEESVKIHLTSDVEVGCYLSGGMDSACVAMFAARNLKYKMKTFTLNAGDDPNEAVNASETANLFEMDNYQADISDAVQANLCRMIWHLEVPKINALQVNEIARLASRHVKVALSGLGGDELFLGYNAHGIMYLAQRYQTTIPEMLTQWAASAAASCSKALPLPIWSETERSVKMLDAIGNWPRFYGLLRNVWDAPGLRQKIYGPRMLDQPLHNTYDYLESQWTAGLNPVQAMADFEWRNKLVNDLLWQEDRCSMAESLEVRVPFLDPLLVKNVNDIAFGHIMPRGQKKGYLRKILTGTIPRKILDRPKSGFQINSQSFYHSSLQYLEEKYLSREVIEKHGLFNPSFVRHVKQYKSCFNLRWHYFMLYLMLTTHIWLEQFEKSG